MRHIAHRLRFVRVANVVPPRSPYILVERLVSSFAISDKCNQYSIEILD